MFTVSGIVHTKVLIFNPGGIGVYNAEVENYLLQFLAR
jgi:hypothetical protein